MTKAFSFVTRSLGLSIVLIAIMVVPSDVVETSSVGPTHENVRVTIDRPSASPAYPYETIAVDDPFAANNSIPYAKAPIEQAFGINLLSAGHDLTAQSSALECLTAAIYHEAGYEPLRGRRAVAQVVLNRVRHPLYPNSVCDVVYQGAERRTGCQFTFTCDGSLTRPASPSAWRSARDIARQSLSGSVEPSVGMATHYHANYVVPYWATSLDKIASVGSHIFYKWKGTLGQRKAFSEDPTFRDVPASGVLEELAQLPRLPSGMASPVEFVMPAAAMPDAALPGRALPKADVKGQSLPSVGQNENRLLADEQAGTLVLDSE